MSLEFFGMILECTNVLRTRGIYNFFDILMFDYKI